MLSLFSCARNYSYINLLWQRNSHVRVFRFVEIRTTGKAKQQGKNRLSNQAEKQKQTQTASCISVTVKGKLAQVSEQRQHPIAEKCRRSRISWRKYRRDKKYNSFTVRFRSKFDNTQAVRAEVFIPRKRKKPCSNAWTWFDISFSQKINRVRAFFTVLAVFRILQIQQKVL